MLFIYIKVDGGMFVMDAETTHPIPIRLSVGSVFKWCFRKNWTSAWPSGVQKAFSSLVCISLIFDSIEEVNYLKFNLSLLDYISNIEF